MRELFDELKNRKVFRVAAIYAVVAWVLIQVSDVVLPTFEAPAWVNQTIIFFFILGFLPTLIAAWAYEVTPEGIKADSRAQTQVQVPAPQSQRLIYATFILVLLAVGFQIADRFLFSSANQTEAIAIDGARSAVASNFSHRFNINIGETTPLAGSLLNTEIALSADGSKLVYRVLRPEIGAESLYLKNLNQLEEQVLANGLTVSPFFSTDGEWVGFLQRESGNLYKLSIRGGVPQLLAESAFGGAGGFWSADDIVYYSADTYKLMRVSANGGVPESLNIVGGNSNSVQSWPYLLPGGDALLYTQSSGTILENRIDLLDQSTGDVRTIVQNGYNARYVPTGHVVFVRDAALWAVPFDTNRLLTTGEEQPVIQGVQTDPFSGSTPYAFSNDGLLIYLPGRERSRAPIETTLIWVDREGKEEPLRPMRKIDRWVVSPDGGHLALSIVDDFGNSDIWIYDLNGDNLRRLTVDEAIDYRPIWTPDGERVVFGSTRDGGGLWWRAADGTGVAERLWEDNDSRGIGASPYSFTPDETQLLYFSGWNIHTLTLGNEFSSRPLIDSEFRTMRATLSPDGRWLAYVSDETGSDEIYIRPFPNIDGGGIVKISRDGGTSPKWSPDGLELFFAGPIGDGGVWVARRATKDTSQFDIPVRAFEGSDAVASTQGTFDISADGSRLLLQRGTENTIPETEFTSLIAVENWFAELNRLAPPDP